MCGLHLQVSEAEGRLQDSKIAYEELVAAMTEELNRQVTPYPSLTRQLYLWHCCQ